MRDLFAQARSTPASILFIDELDAVGKTRGLGGSLGGNDEREQTLNQLLTEMDGFETTSGLIVVAATNRPEILDAALLRPGRFDRRVYVDRPDLSERAAILGVHARRVRLGPGVDLAGVASLTVGLAGADLANIVNEAALLAARRRADAVDQSDLEEALERAVAGLPRRARRLSSRERTVVAYHEAGHALLAELLPHAGSPCARSPSCRAGRARSATPAGAEEDRFPPEPPGDQGPLVVLLGGRVAEEATVGEISTGAQDDLLTRDRPGAADGARARDERRDGALELRAAAGRALARRPPRGRARLQRGDRARGGRGVSRLLGEAQGRARTLIADHRDVLARIAGAGCSRPRPYRGAGAARARPGGPRGASGGGDVIEPTAEGSTDERTPGAPRPDEDGPAGPYPGKSGEAPRPLCPLLTTQRAPSSARARGARGMSIAGAPEGKEWHLASTTISTSEGLAAAPPGAPDEAPGRDAIEVRFASPRSFAHRSAWTYLGHAAIHPSNLLLLIGVMFLSLILWSAPVLFVGLGIEAGLLLAAPYHALLPPAHRRVHRRGRARGGAEGARGADPRDERVAPPELAPHRGAARQDPRERGAAGGHDPARRDRACRRRPAPHELHPARHRAQGLPRRASP